MNSFPVHRPGAAARILIAAVIVIGCQAGEDRSATADSAAGADTASGMAGMPGMSGMSGMGGMMSTAMMDSMHMHMQMMDSLNADRVEAMLPRHRQMAANMLSQMNSEMRSMNMAADSEWNATVDSLRQDLIRMPEMGGQELKAMMPSHHARMMRLMQMHRDMVGGMAPDR